MGKGPRHRGAINNPAVFARNFIQGRLSGFKKDMNICLTGTEKQSGTGKTHAYFPALAACCGMMEYLTALYLGKIKGIGWQQVSLWANQYLPQPDYDQDAVRILVDAFRNSVAHRGIASGIWVDKKPGPGLGRRLTWKVLADARRPAIRIVSEDGILKKDPPWDCPYTHRVHIHLKSMKVDIRNAADSYINDVRTDQDLQRKFVNCMRKLYPA